jgi:tripeptide aminopeptidase
MASTAPASAFARVAQLAADRRIHQAFQWMHLHEQQILRWQTELVSVPAPPFGERARAEWLCDRFREQGLAEVGLDAEGNAIGRLKAADPCEHCVLISAHIDTVFPSDTPIEPRIEGTRLYAPGACDNGAGVVSLLALSAALQQAGISPQCDIFFVGNVGEEGEGDLRGMRHLYQHAEWRDRIHAHIVLDGAGHEVAVTEALGSQRYLVTIRGQGGHSWTDAGKPNPIITLSHAIARLSELDLSGPPRTTLNVGTIEGGTAINAIPEQASARFDCRSTDPEQLIRLEVDAWLTSRRCSNRCALSTGTSAFAPNPALPRPMPMSPFRWESAPSALGQEAKEAAFIPAPSGTTPAAASLDCAVFCSSCSRWLLTDRAGDC